MKRSRELFNYLLIDLYPLEEINAIFSIAVNWVKGYSSTDIHLKAGEIFSELDYLRLKKIADQLKKSIPIQYILGETEFYGLHFNVNPSVLIPRNETEELVDIIVKNYCSKSPKILDIGTGSGCIPIALKKNIQTATIFACDISEAALEVARINAILNNAEIHFLHFDILSSAKFPEEKFDVIVSNPPYVTRNEIALMNINVLANEPHLALFVSNEDPLVFYRNIVENYSNLLTPSGELYFEINEAYGKEVQELCSKNGFESKLLTDINGKDRMIWAKKFV